EPDLARPHGAHRLDDVLAPAADRILGHQPGAVEPERPRSSEFDRDRRAVIGGPGDESSLALRPLARRLELTGGVVGPVPMQADPHGFANPLLLEMDGELAGDPLVDGNALLRDAERAGDILVGDDPVRTGAADLGRAVAVEPVAIGGAARVPGMLAEVGLA